MTTPLDEELAYFQSRRAELVASDRGRFVLIKGSTLVGIFDTFDAALERGYTAFGNVPFLVHEITEVDVPVFFSGFFW